MACAIVRGLDGRIEKHLTNPHESPADLVADNPLSKVPCLITDDGLSLFGSQLICEYLDSLGDELPLFPEQARSFFRLTQVAPIQSVRLQLQRLHSLHRDVSSRLSLRRVRPEEFA